MSTKVSKCSFKGGDVSVNVNWDADFASSFSDIARGLQANAEGLAANASAYSSLISVLKTQGAEVNLGSMIHMTGLNEPEHSADPDFDFGLDA